MWIRFVSLPPVFLFSALALFSTACETSSPSVAQGADALTAKPAAKPADAVAAVGNEKADKVLVYYFHGARRCKTCLGIQSTIEQTISGRFPADTASGRLAYREVNIDEEANKHFIEEYKVSFSTMTVAAMQGDKALQWESCEKIWDYAENPPQLTEYAAERIKAYLDKLEAK